MQRGLSASAWSEVPSSNTVTANGWVVNATTGACSMQEYMHSYSNQGIIEWTLIVNCEIS